MDATKDVTAIFIEIFSTEKIIKASDQFHGDMFGASVSISGNYAIVGADSADSGGPKHGQAYIYH